MDRNKHTLAHDLIRLSSSATSTAFTAKTPTLTKPSGSNVIDMQDQNIAWTTDLSHVPDMLHIQPYGSDAANEDYHMRLFGWSKMYEPATAAVHELWVPALIGQFTVTLGNVAATALGTNHFLADTISLDVGSTAVVTVQSPGNDTPGYFIADITGFEMIEFDFDKDAGATEAATCNVLVRGIS